MPCQGTIEESCGTLPGSDLAGALLQLLERQAAEFEAASHLAAWSRDHLAEAGRSTLTLLLNPLEDLLAGRLGPVPPPLRDPLGRMHRQAQQLLGAIEDIDDLFEPVPATGQGETPLQDLVGFLRRLLHRFQGEAPGPGRLYLDADAERLLVPFRADVLGQALAHLLRFALRRAGPGGSVGVQLASRDLFGRGPVRLSVSDDGPVLGSLQREALLHGTAGPGGPAAGAALDFFLARRLLNQGGHQVRLASRPDGGAVVHVRMLAMPGTNAAGADRAVADARGDALPGPAEAVPSRAPDPGARLRTPKAVGAVSAPDERPTILLAHGSAEARAYLGAWLRPYPIVEAADAGEALRAIQARRPALVVAAVASPRIDGAALLHALKADPGLADIPVVLTSNRHSEALKVRMLKAGADAYLVEPFRADELRARVQNLLVVEEREKRMRLLAREAQLKMLRYQLNPHFLFNALNAIRALVLSDAARSRQLVTALAEYLRYSLRTANDLEVSLQEEVTSVQSYLEIEKIRFEEDLDVAVEVQPGAADCRVPGVLLQPLVENAVKYGMATSPMPLRLRILGTIGGGRLHLEVANTGRWQPPEQTQGTSTGIGLRNLRQRLQRFYPGRHRFAVSEEAGWVRAVIDIDLPILST